METNLQELMLAIKNGNRPGLELAPILDIPQFLDCGAAAEDISVCVPHQLLDPYECHIEMSYIAAPSSTTDLRKISDTRKHFEYNFIKNQSFSNDKKNKLVKF